MKSDLKIDFGKALSISTKEYLRNANYLVA